MKITSPTGRVCNNVFCKFVKFSLFQGFYVFCKEILLPGKIVMCSSRKILKKPIKINNNKRPPKRCSSNIFSFLAKLWCVLQEKFWKNHWNKQKDLLRGVLQTNLAPGNMSNFSFLAAAEQIICRTPPLAASANPRDGLGLWK